MQASKPKPYFIELYSAEDKSLRNKFKFILDASTVKELRQLIKDKLISKNELDVDSQISMKDNDDYQLASDDEVKDVIPDGKIKLYKKIKNIIQTNVPQAVVQPVVPQPVNAVNAPVVNAVQNVMNLVCKQSLLNLSNLNIPIIGAQVKHKLRVICPQIRKALIELPFSENLMSYLDLSIFIVKALGLDPSLKAILYNKYGQPFLYNLDLMHFPIPKIDFSQELSVIFTKTSSVVDQPIQVPAFVSNNLCSISVIQGENKFNIDIDITNTLAVLRYKIYESTKIHPSNQIIKFGNLPLTNNAEAINSFGITDKSILELSFKLNSNLVPCTFADKFYYKDIKHTQQQTQESITQLRAHLLILSAHLSSDDKLKIVSFIRGLTLNMPLTFGLKCLLNNTFVSQTHRIAIEQGLLVCLAEYVNRCTPTLDQLQFKNIFSQLRNFIGYVLQGVKKITNLQQIKKTQQLVEVQRNCHFTIKPIKHARIIKLDNEQKVIVDRQSFQEQILKGFTFPFLKTAKVQNLYSTKDLQQIYYQYLINQIDNANTNSLYWIGFQEKHPFVELPKYESVDKYVENIDSYPEMKVHMPLEIKNKSSSYLLLKNKQNKLKVFVSKNKDISKPFNLFDVFNGNQEAVNLDLMSANVKTQNVEEVINSGDLKPVITREPKEAIAILFDVSGSMSSQFFNQPDLKRIGAVKSFFEAFAYRTIAYNLEHVVSLFFFDHTVQNQCGFTEAIYDFNRLISQAAPRGSTLMFDAVMTAIDQLKKFKIRYPDCILRIVALTDGEDTGSKTSIEEAARVLVENHIVIDSFAVGANCDGLKVISKASGGKCYLTRNLEQSLKLFEQETVLSVRARKIQIASCLSLQQRIQNAKASPFDLPNNVHEFKMPEVKPGFSAQDIMKRMETSEQSKKISGNGCLKRIAKQIHNFTSNPHPFVAIFPCSNINIWKILLVGPKDTPYENGLFLLYAQFPGDYPFKAPEVRFITPIYHCNMNSQGRICHSVFDRNYSPALSFRQIMDCVYGLILTPQPQDPLDNVIASFYLSDYQTYLVKAKQFTKEKASMSTQKIVDELFGKIVDDCERKQKEKEIDDWIAKAKSFN